MNSIFTTSGAEFRRYTAYELSMMARATYSDLFSTARDTAVGLVMLADNADLTALTAAFDTIEFTRESALSTGYNVPPAVVTARVWGCQIWSEAGNDGFVTVVLHTRPFLSEPQTYRLNGAQDLIFLRKGGYLPTSEFASAMHQFGPSIYRDPSAV